MAYGETDECGQSIVANPVHVHDYHATILHLMGIDHTRLTYRYAGRDFRLTDVAGRWSTRSSRDGTVSDRTSDPPRLRAFRAAGTVVIGLSDERNLRNVLTRFDVIRSGIVSVSRMPC